MNGARQDDLFLSSVWPHLNESSLNMGLVCAVSNDRSFRATPTHEVDGLDKHGLTRASLTSKDSETIIERQPRGLNDSKILN
jgi:hypothetical protein